MTYLVFVFWYTWYFAHLSLSLLPYLQNMYEEEKNPVVEPAKGIKFNGTRYSSQEGFDYHKQKIAEE